MQKEIFFTSEEMQIIRVCLHNAPIPYDHGDGAKLNDLPGIVSQRYRDVWSEVKYVEVHRGHYHTNKAYKMQAVEELNGLTIRNLSSMTATDEWHDMKGFVGNVKKASAFIWNKYNGVQAKLNYNVPIE